MTPLISIQYPPFAILRVLFATSILMFLNPVPTFPSLLRVANLNVSNEYHDKENLWSNEIHTMLNRKAHFLPCSDLAVTLEASRVR